MVENGRRLDLVALKKCYEEIGLTRLEIAPAIGRAKNLQIFLEEMAKNGAVIDPEDWGTPAINDRIRRNHDADPSTFLCPQNCYFVRHTTGGY
jgi:hypothetical protein